MMRRSLFSIIFLLIWASASCQSDDKLEYLGSFTFVRSTESGHTYVSEFRLWQHSTKVSGVYLKVAGLDGDPVVRAHKIINGTIRSDGDISLETKWYKFEGKYLDGRLDGVLMQGSSVVWGGIEGSNKMQLKTGLSIEQVVERECGSVVELDNWIDEIVDE